jgi:hypothetical protein
VNERQSHRPDAATGKKDHPQAQQAQQPGGGGAPATGTAANPTDVPGESNTAGGALNTKPGAERHGMGTDG